MKNRQKEIITFNNTWRLSKNSNRGLYCKLAKEEKNLKLIFDYLSKQIFLFIYGEYAERRKNY
jgi:hypothetical protein